MDFSTPHFPVHHQLPELTQTHVHRVGDAIQPFHPLLTLLLPPSIFPSIKVFSSESVLHIRWPKNWHFSLSISLSNQYSGLISFRIDWLDLLADQDTQESSPIPRFKSVLQHSTFFIVKLSHPYMTTGKTIALTRWTFVRKVMSLGFIMLSRLVIAFLPRGNHLFLSWLQAPSIVILESKNIKSLTVSIFFSIYLP